MLSARPEAISSTPRTFIQTGPANRSSAGLWRDTARALSWPRNTALPVRAPTRTRPATSVRIWRSQWKRLKRLRTNYIDLYWVHIWDHMTPVEEVMRGLDDLVRAGKVLYVGISDAPAWWIAQANTLAHLRGWSPFIGLQIEYSLIERTVERELVPMAKALNLGVTAWSPLAGGVLTGKYHGHGGSSASPGEPGRMNNDMSKDFMPEPKRTERIIAAVKSVCDETGRG